MFMHKFADFQSPVKEIYEKEYTAFGYRKNDTGAFHIYEHDVNVIIATLFNVQKHNVPINVWNRTIFRRILKHYQSTVTLLADLTNNLKLRR